VKDSTPPTRPRHEPDANLLAAHAEGRLGREESDALVVHLADCAACRETAALMARALGGAPAGRRPPIPAAAGWLALAATLVLATIVGTRIRRERPSLAPSIEPPPSPAAPASAVPEAPATTAPAPPPAAPPPDVRRGGGERHVAGKTFRLVAGEWVDAAYDATAGLPVVEVSDAAARAKVLREHPELSPCAAQGRRVLVVLGGTVYRFDAPAR
jgi:hypothetical protein